MRFVPFRFLRLGAMAMAEAEAAEAEAKEEERALKNCEKEEEEIMMEGWRRHIGSASKMV